MESNNYFFIPPQQRKSNHKAIVAVIAGLAILGAVVFVAFNAETEMVNNQAFFSKYTLEEEEAFDSFLKTYKKQYLSASEHNSRLGVFVNNYRFIKAANEDEFLTYEVAVNEFADMTLEEFELSYLGIPSTESLTPDNSEVLTVTPEMVAAVPVSVDFRPQLVRVKNQGGCGSCWTFSVVATLDYFSNNQTGNVTTYSEQELLDCSKPYGTFQCQGGWMKDGLRYVIDNGITLGANYTYVARAQTCQNSTTPRSLKIGGQGTIKKNDNDALLVAAASNVLAVTVSSRSQGWQFYNKGIINGNCGTETSHAVNIVGYGTDNGTDYWIVRNSWGANWGDKGYTKVLRETGVKPAVCGISEVVNYPTASK